jgi:general secretion pathway protein G
MKKLKSKNIKKAFTLMELMVVIVILGLLAAFVLPNLTGKSEEAKQKLTCVQMKSIAQAIKLFKIDNSRYPTTQEGLEVLINGSQDLQGFPKGGYFEDKKLPKDPWQNDYIYTSSEDGFDIISLGANKAEGGGDDIYLSKCK